MIRERTGARSVFELPTITVPNNVWLTENGRYYYMEKYRREQKLQQLAYYSWLRIGELDFEWPVLLIAEIGYPTNNRADPHNATPTLKALIDGGTKAGLWPDDNSDYIHGLLPLRAQAKAPRGTHTITFTVDP